MAEPLWIDESFCHFLRPVVQTAERNSFIKDNAAPAAMDSVLYLQAIT